MKYNINKTKSIIYVINIPFSKILLNYIDSTTNDNIHINTI